MSTAALLRGVVHALDSAQRHSLFPSSPCFSSHSPAPKALVPDDTEAAADKVHQAHDWKASEAAYSSLTQKAPANARFLYRLGAAQKALGKYDDALSPPSPKAESAGTPRYLSQYAIAEAQALKGSPTASFTALG